MQAHMTHLFTDEEHTALDLLRANGFVVVAFTPEELDGVHPRHFEDRLTEMGNEYIAANGNGTCETCGDPLSGTGDDYCGRCPSCADKEVADESGAFETHEEGY